MALIVLGAGASRGASFVGAPELHNICKPPLDGDFFNQLQLIASDKHQETIDNTIADLMDLFETDFHITLETAFTTIEHTLLVMNITGANAKLREKLQQRRKNLLQAIAAVLEESLTKYVEEEHTREYLLCEYHKALVQQLRRRDVILSFNYDCLIDASLKEFGNRKWNARFGYCLPLPIGRNQPIGEKHWYKTLPKIADKDSTIKLLKLHGSIHFSKQGKYIFLKERPYTRQHGNLNFEIIPPEWNKRFDNQIFSKLWVRAREAIDAARTIVFIGYSFPVNDQHSAALFRIGVSKKRLRNVVVVNPDKSVRRRTVNIVRRGISIDTRVLEFESFKEFHTVPRELWDS